MEIKDIYNLLDRGWIYVDLKDKYFNSAFLPHIPKKYQKNIGKAIFIKKSNQLYEILRSLGADISQYDAMVSIRLRKIDDRIEVDCESLSDAGNLIDVAKIIMDNI